MREHLTDELIAYATDYRSDYIHTKSNVNYRSSVLFCHPLKPPPQWLCDSGIAALPALILVSAMGLCGPGQTRAIRSM